MTGSRFDFVIVGGGAAGLSPALHLLNSPLRKCSILIVEQEPDGIDHHTWAYWTDGPTLFDGVTHRCWTQLRVVLGNAETTLCTGRYQYAIG